MKKLYTGKSFFMTCCLLLTLCTLSAKTDTLSYIGEIGRRDTTESLRIFHKFNWNVIAKYKDGSTSKHITSRPDTLFKSNNLDSVYLTTEFYVDTAVLNRVLSLHYALEGSVRIIMNGYGILTTGVFQNKGDARKLIQKEYTDFILNDTLEKMEITYLPYNTNSFNLRLAILQKHLALKKIEEQSKDEQGLYSKGFYYLAFSIVFLIMFTFFKENTENLYFSLFCMFAAIAFLSQLLNSDALYNLKSFFAVFCFEFLSIFFCKVLMNKEKSKIPLIIIAGISIVCSLPFIRYGIQFAFGERAPWFIIITNLVLFAYVLISTLFYLVQGIGQKRWEAKTILIVCLVPIVVLVSLVIILFFIAAIDISKGFSNSFLPRLIGYFATSIIYIYPLAAVFILGKRNGLNQRKLIAQVKSIQQLSEDNLVKEKEKQDILEGQKESLEREVAQRTLEVVAQKERIEIQHNELKIEKEKSDELLRNILPEEVAEELKANGKTTARHFDNVTVLFTDFVNFTQAGEKMSPQGLIDELHTCFKAFDEITGKYGIEKIKTIGDAYLAVAGLPSSDSDHAENTVRAAIEINAFMAKRQADQSNGNLSFAIRIGVHSGSVIAGIVGVKKFAYDIWGDTVNTAARMEQHGEAGKINISQSTYDLVKDKFNCEYRGEVTAKGKGAMKMYFVSSAKALA